MNANKCVSKTPVVGDATPRVPFALYVPRIKTNVNSDLRDARERVPYIHKYGVSEQV